MFFVFFSFNSCSSFLPVSGKGGLAVSSSIEEVVPFWQPLEGAGSGGIRFFSGRIREPKLDFYALRVDLNDPELVIVINRPSTGMFVSSFTARYNCTAGINTTPFFPSSNKEGEERTVTGITIAENELLTPPVSRYDALVFFVDGGAAIVNQGEIVDFSGIKNASGGFFRVLENGRLPKRLFESDNQHPESLKQNLPKAPRSAAGLSQDGAVLFLIAVDGNRLNSSGANEAELGLLLRSLGAFSGLNLDGGGSSSMALRFPDGSVKPVNIPTHNRIPNSERAVSSFLGIKFD